jgi:hypothetical protein
VPSAACSAPALNGSGCGSQAPAGAAARASISGLASGDDGAARRSSAAGRPARRAAPKVASRSHAGLRQQHGRGASETLASERSNSPVSSADSGWRETKKNGAPCLFQAPSEQLLLLVVALRERKHGVRALRPRISTPASRGCWPRPAATPAGRAARCAPPQRRARNGRGRSLAWPPGAASAALSRAGHALGCSGC